MKTLKRLFFWDALQLCKPEVAPAELDAVSNLALRQTQSPREPVWQSGLFAFFRSAAGPNFYRLLKLATVKVPMEFVAPLCLTPLLSAMDQNLSGAAFAWGLTIVFGSIVHGLVQNHFFNIEILIMASMERLGLERIAKNSTRQKLTFATHDVPTVTTATINYAEIYTRALILASGLTLLFFKIGWAALACVALILLIGPIVRRFSHGIESASTRLAQARGERVDYLASLVKTLAVHKLLGMEPVLAQKAGKLRQVEARCKRSLTWQSLLPTLIFYLGSSAVSIVAFAVYLLLGGQLTVEKIFSTFLILKIIEEPLSSYASFFTSLARARASFQRLVEAATETHTAQAGLRAFSDDRHIAIEVQPQSIAVRKGTRIGVVGTTGSGKSTLLNKIYESLRGREKCHFVAQTPFAFEGSLKENIFLDHTRPDQELTAALKICELDNLRDPLNLVIGESGAGLSGGEKQRLSLTRAAMTTADVLFLDDAFSALDRATRSRVTERLLNNRWADATVFVVSASEQELQYCQCFLLIEGSTVTHIASLSELKMRLDLLALDSGHADTVSASQIPAADTSEKIVFNLWSSIWTYLRQFDPRGRFPWRISLFLIILLLSTVAGGLQNAWLSVWAHPGDATSLIERALEYLAREIGMSAQSPFQGLFVYVGFALVFLAMIVVRVVFWELGAIDAGSRLLRQAVQGLLGGEPGAVEKIGAQQIAQRLSDDYNSVDDVVSSALEDAVSALVALLTCFVTVSFAAPLTLWAFAAATGVWIRLFNQYLGAQQRLRWKSLAIKGQWIGRLRALEGAQKPIEQIGAESFFQARLKAEFEDYQRVSLAQNILGRWFFGLSPVLAGGVFLVTLGGVILFSKGGSAGALVITFSLQQWMLLNWMARTLTGVQTYGISLHRLDELTRLPQEETRNEPADPSANAKSLVFDNVTVGYDQDILFTPAFRLKTGEMLFIQGRTGAGKSTLTKSLLGYAKIRKGSIHFGEKIISGTAHLREQCAYVAQEPALLEGSVAHNLDPLQRHGKEDLWSTLRTIQLHGRVDSDPLGLDMDPASLSQGEQQLLCLGRALLLQRPILILDEVSAQLDVSTEAKISQILKAVKGRYIVIVIGHRDELKRHADLVMTVAQGQAQLDRVSSPVLSRAIHRL